MKIQLTEGDKGIGPVVWGRIISTHALTEGDIQHDALFPSRDISTHALTEGDDSSDHFISIVIISTHALTEGDFILKYQDNIRFLFQLTPSRRATANLDKFFF